MTKTPIKGICLKAEDKEDFKIIAACLQDSVIRQSEMTYLSSDRRFVTVLDRLVWENSDRMSPGNLPSLQVQSGLCFEGITSVKVHGIDQNQKDRILELLTIFFNPASVTLLFTGGAAIKLEGENILCFLEDVSAPRAISAPLSDSVE